MVKIVLGSDLSLTPAPCSYAGAWPAKPPHDSGLEPLRARVEVADPLGHRNVLGCVLLDCDSRGRNGLRFGTHDRPVEYGCLDLAGRLGLDLVAVRRRLVALPFAAWAAASALALRRPVDRDVTLGRCFSFDIRLLRRNGLRRDRCLVHLGA